jgi:hypothetical protein
VGISPPPAMNDRRVAGGIAISGIFDLRADPPQLSDDKLGMDVAEARAQQPSSSTCHPRPSPTRGVRGSRELPELIRQSDEYAAAWRGHGLPGEYIPVPDHDHFFDPRGAARPSGRLFAALEKLAARRIAPLPLRLLLWRRCLSHELLQRFVRLRPPTTP